MPTRELEAKLKQSQESLEFALQSGKMGAWDIDLKEMTIHCSKEMLDLWGVSEAEFNGQRSVLQAKVHPEDLFQMNESIDIAIAKNGIYERSYRILPSPGVLRWVTSRGRCYFEGESNVPVRFSGVVFDITESKLKEEALEAAVKARDHFLMIAGHELKTPITSLHLQQQVMKWDLQNKAPAASLETSLHKQEELLLRIDRIIDNIIVESKIAEGRLVLRPQHFDLKEMVLEVLENFKLTARTSGVNVNLRQVQSVPGSWDRYQLEQVLHNLLSNALRYGNNSPVDVEVTKTAGNAIIKVSDRGIGINAEDRDRIFERFQRAVSEEEVSGMGLGLYIANHIVRAHRGFIDLKSEPGKGSEFSVIIPYNEGFKRVD